MIFTLRLKPHEHENGSLMHVVAVQISDDGKIMNETKVGYITKKYADRLEFKDMTD